jgi:hypothetical protein
MKGKAKKEVDGHWHPLYGILKAGAIVDIETGEDGSYPDQIFDKVEEKKTPSLAADTTKGGE